MTQFQRGERAAFEGIVRLWERSLFYYLRRLAPSEADAWDLLQETWMKVFRALKSLRDPHAFAAFLYTTARHAAITRLRIREPESGLPDTTEEPQVSDFAFVAFDNAEEVHHALDKLPLAQREVLTLYFLEELSIDEIAQVLSVPAGTVKSRLHYGKQAIRRILCDGDDHDKPGANGIPRPVAARAADDAGAA